MYESFFSFAIASSMLVGFACAGMIAVIKMFTQR
jgi:hypothetical protein